MLTVLKLGGSVITNKDEPETVDEHALERSCDSIAAFLSDETGDDDRQLILVHGGGSFGHHHAAAHGVSDTEGTTDARAVGTIHRAMTELNDGVLDALRERGVEALPVRPLSVAHRDADGLHFPSTVVEVMCTEGFVPVTHGDAVVHTDVGGTILSGDDIVVSLARAMDADRVGLCSTVPGVLDDSGVVVPTIESYSDVADVLGGSDATDVTGGMAHKVSQLLDLDAPASVFDVDSLDAFLETGTAGTVIRGSESNSS